MKLKTTLIGLSVLLVCAVSFGEETKIPSSLRGGIKADQNIINTALQMQKQGWAYVMPRPKSKQARWGNADGRTTWWIGYWHNEKAKQYSSSIPKLKEGVYVGDGKASRGWRRGGSPRRPIKIEWLLSKTGGTPPKD